MPIIVYKMDVSPPARAVLITADILGLDIETREVNILAKEQLAAEYLEKNPLHTIPLIEDGDFVLSDSHAIMIYLISKYGNEKAATLYPSDLEIRSNIHQKLFFNASILFPSLRNLVGDVLYNGAIALEDDKIAKVDEAYGFLEKYLERNTFVAGDSMTIADIACITTVTSNTVLVPLDNKYPKIQAWIELISAEGWYQKFNQPAIAGFGVAFAALLQKNAE